MAIIESYGHKTSPYIFRGKEERASKDVLIFGVEVEILRGDNKKVSPWHCLRATEKTQTRQDKKFIDTIEFDSSVDLEFKTEAFTMEAWRQYGYKRMQFFFDYLYRKNYKAWSGDKCGMHIHVSPCFNFDFLCAEAKKHQELLFKASGRISETNQYCNWNDIGRSVKYVPIRHCDDGHYEFRLWRGTLSVNMLDMYLKLTEYMVNCAKHKVPFNEKEIMELLIKPERR